MATARREHDVSTTRTAAVVASGLLGVAAVHQVALASGAPWGDAAYGGRAPTTAGVLDPPYRWVSAVAAVNLSVSAWVVAMSGGVVRRRPLGARALRTWTWVITAALAGNTVANLAARHPAERWGLGTLTAMASVLCSVVATSSPAVQPDGAGAQQT